MSGIKIGFDAKRLFLNFTGLGNYSRNLVHRYHLQYPEDELYLFTPDLSQDARTTPFIDDSSYTIIRPQGFKPLWRTLEMVQDIAASHLQVYHGLSHELPTGLSKLHVGKVVTIHDLIFKYYTQDYSRIDRQIYDWKWKHACHAADVIIAISEQTKHDIVHYYNIPPEKIQVIYQDIDPVFSSRVTSDMISSVRSTYGLPSTYNLYVGSLISRKNLLSIIRAMALHPEHERVPLVIIGQGDSYKKEVIAAAMRHRIQPLLHWLGSPSFHDFPALYAGAQMMIYPSFHEGFGLPVVEAMQIGIPVITSNQSSLKEAGGDAALLTDPASPEELASAMQRIQSDEFLRQHMIEKGRLHAARLSGSGWIDKHHAIYHSLEPGVVYL